MSDKRTVYLIKEDGSKQQIDFKDIKKGMTVELYEPNGEQVLEKQFVVQSDAFINDENTLCFEYENG
jgi:hypothetical protein